MTTDYAKGSDRPYWVGVDFDGTCVIPGENYPEIYSDMPFAVDILQKIVREGGSLLLVTSREGKDLEDAVAWFEKHQIPLAGVNENPDPFWAGHRKIYCDILIDDRAAGCPKFWFSETGEEIVEWFGVAGIVLNSMLEMRNSWKTNP